MPALHPVTSARDVHDHTFMCKKDAAVSVSVLWAIWSNRNKYTHKEIAYQPYRSMQLIQELVRALDIPAVEEQQVKTQPKWDPPSVGWIKVNTDGAVGCAQKCAGTGAIARDHSGMFAAAQTTKYAAISDPFIIESLACRDGLRMAMEKGYQKVILETDCQMIDTAWDAGQDRSEAGHIFREMKMYLSNFQGFSLVFSNRSANFAAHLCAKEALNMECCSSSFDVIPAFLIGQVQSEFVPLNQQ